MPFRNQIVAAGSGNLVLDQIQSPNFDASAHTGWQIKKDGTATFYSSVSGENFLLGPVNLSGTPYLNLVKLFKMMGEVATPKWETISALYTTTTSYADPGFGTIGLPVSSSFTGTGAANVKIELFASLNSGSTIPSGAFTAQALKDGVLMAQNSTSTVTLQTANDRRPLYVVWDDTVTYVAGTPQESFTLQVKDSAGPNHYIMHSDTRVRATVTIDPQYFLQA